MSGGSPAAPGQIRISPDSRLPARARRSHGILQDARLAWILTGRAVARMPVLFLCVTTGWGAARFIAWQSLHQAHLGLASADTIAEFDFWARLGLTADLVLLALGPLILSAVLWPPVHRMILGAPAPAWLAGAARAGKVAAAAICLVLAFLLAAGFCAGLPLALRGALGNLSTLLLLILLAPLFAAAAVALFRLALGLPAVSIGLPRGLAEGWMISRGHVARSASVVLLAGLPAMAASAAWLALPSPYGWPATILRPVTDVAAVALTASVTGVLYRATRLPPAFRPDRRPSRNRNQRRQPVFT